MAESSSPSWNGDLLAAAGWVALAWGAILLPSGVGGVRVVVVLPLVLFWPGYVVVAALFPAAPMSRVDRDGTEGRDFDQILEDEPTAVERLVFATAASVGIGVLLGSGLAVSPLPLSIEAALGSVTVVVLGGAAVAQYRRSTVERPEDETPILSREWLPNSRRVWSRESRDAIETTIAVLVILSSVAGAGGVIYLSTVHEPTGYTAFGVQPAATTGNITAGDYQRALESGRGLKLHLTNHRSERMRYTVVVRVQRVAGTDGGIVVAETRRIDRFSVVVSAGESWQRVHRPDLPWVNATRRLQYQLYRIDEIERRHIATAQVWVNRTTAKVATLVVEVASR